MKGELHGWREVWRKGVAPQLSLAALDALEMGLRTDDPALMQGMTTSPPPLQCLLDCPLEGADLIAYAVWKSDGLNTVGQVEEAFARVCFEADKALGEPAAIRYLLNTFDDAPRAEFFPALLAEVQQSINLRAQEDFDRSFDDGTLFLLDAVDAAQPTAPFLTDLMPT